MFSSEFSIPKSCIQRQLDPTTYLGSCFSTFSSNFRFSYWYFRDIDLEAASLLTSMEAWEERAFPMCMGAWPLDDKEFKALSWGPPIPELNFRCPAETTDFEKGAKVLPFCWPAMCDTLYRDLRPFSVRILRPSTPLLYWNFALFRNTFLIGFGEIKVPCWKLWIWSDFWRCFEVVWQRSSVGTLFPSKFKPMWHDFQFLLLDQSW